MKISSWTLSLIFNNIRKSKNRFQPNNISVELKILQVMINKFIKNTSTKFSNTLTYKVTMTINLIFVVFCILLTALYIIGNYQNFLDKTQEIILSLLSYVSIFSALLSFLLLIESIVKIFTEKYKIRSIIYSFLLLLSIIFCVSSTGIAGIISYLSMGISQWLKQK